MTDLVDLGALSDACRLPYKQRRIALRGLVQPVLEQMFSKADVELLIRTSPIIGTGDKQVSIRPQISGLRDQFDLPTLTAIAMVVLWPFLQGMNVVQVDTVAACILAGMVLTDM